MPATAELEAWTGDDGSGNPASKTTASSFRFRTDDSPTTIDTSNPLIVPDSGLNHSFYMSIAVAFSGTFDEVSNIRFHTDGGIGYTLGTNGGVVRGNRDSGDNGVTEANYEEATGTVGSSGDDLGSNHGYFSGQSTPEADISNDTSSSPATIDSNTYTSNTSTKAVVLQADIDTDASSGVQSDETITFLYDEI